MATVLYEYAAKFICGVQKDREDLRLTPGVYGTEINVHNPNDHTVRFHKKLALTFRPGEQRPGEILRFPEEDYLRPDQALAVDCNHVRKTLLVLQPHLLFPAVVVCAPSTGLMASTPPGPGQHEARRDRSGPHQRDQQAADLGNGEWEQAEPAV
jgi:hypothetical protein